MSVLAPLWLPDGTLEVVKAASRELKRLVRQHTRGFNHIQVAQKVAKERFRVKKGVGFGWPSGGAVPMDHISC
eukprot:CAMPEP_0174370724 /NCGR_PEP_ID=MMETSP0811_2-20130205/97119_1 /TAXON_ID=73025 ORGANISM="Eutreptiella gymnastica-like, Strain CCMP1594" /NCGR_SAMPLE_ID=MMETSP0811_2 /ASSEMBLY_ACC=CAM_ASM_000667 /LENGTH=72 /DNA_ID=CAMNT_0015516409 /DNA_START=510 /DNA_END=726 /DNA_ORIENTATION=-